MEPVDPGTFRPGARLPAALFTRQGVKLLTAEISLTEAMCRTLGQFGKDELFLAHSIDELRRAGIVRAAPAALLPKAGGLAEADLVTLGGVLAVETGEPVEPHHLDALELGAFVGMDQRDAARLRAQRVKLADDVAADREERWSRVPLTIAKDGVLANDQDEGDEIIPASELPGWRKVRVAALRRAMARVLAGVPTDVAEFETLTSELIEVCRARPSRFGQVALAGVGGAEVGDFLPEHAYTVAALCVAMGVRLGWGDEAVRHAALAGMLSDIGMGLIPRAVRSSKRVLDEIDSNRVRRHPTFSVILLDTVEGLPDAVTLAAYQHHERENGSGYPRGLKTKQIGDLARAVAAADTFAASVASRPYKPAKRPYDALEDLINLGAERVLDRKVVRSLVEATGLFPVGSFVKLSTGDVAEVIGAHPEMIDRPIVRVVRREGSSLVSGETLDLAAFQPWDLHVILAADRPGS
ncbi:MAG: HD-GYP domain-containing protein [Phycisphaerales bacterium]